MKTMNAAKFKEQCLKVLDEVDPDGVVITKHGKPIAKLIPFGADSKDLFGSLKNRIEIKGDLLSTGLKWDAES